MQTTFRQQLAYGKIGESIIARYFLGKGYSVLPVYEKEINEGKGPTLFQVNRSLICPDILVFRADKPTRWIEAKHKSAFTWHRITERWTTGIDLRHYADYLEVAASTPFEVWLLFLHREGVAKDTPHGMVSPTGLYGGPLTYLSKNENHRSDKWGKSGMVYWAHDKLKMIATLAQVAAPAPPPPEYALERVP